MIYVFSIYPVSLHANKNVHTIFLSRLELMKWMGQGNEQILHNLILATCKLENTLSLVCITLNRNTVYRILSFSLQKKFYHVETDEA